MYSFTQNELEETSDKIKSIVVSALVRQELIEEDDADEWCAEHTIIIREKSFFRTISDLWKKEKSNKGEHHFVVVERV